MRATTASKDLAGKKLNAKMANALPWTAIFRWSSKMETAFMRNVQALKANVTADTACIHWRAFPSITAAEIHVKTVQLMVKCATLKHA